MSRDPIATDDRMKISELLARYCHAMDASRADLCIGLFVEDAVLETPVGTAEGRPAILGWIEERLSLRSPEHQVGHYLLNPLFAPLGPTRVSVRSMLLYTRQTRGVDLSAQLLGTGIYEDEVVEIESNWYFARRRWGLSEALNDIYYTSGATSD